MFKSIFKSTYLQPVLTVVLLAAIAILIFQFSGNKSSNSQNGTIKEVARKVTFTEAAEKFFSNSYQIYTRGSLMVKPQADENNISQSIPTSTIQPSVTPNNTTKITESMYTDLFFFSQNGNIKRIDINTYGQSDSRFFDESGDYVVVNNTNKVYSVTQKNSTDQSDANKALIESATKLFSEFFPLVPLLSDYKESKFNPVERAYNIYSGKWQHPFFTSNEVVDVFLETDPTTGCFRSITIIHEFTETESTIYFDFKEKEINQDLFKVNEAYTKVE